MQLPEYKKKPFFYFGQYLSCSEKCPAEWNLSYKNYILKKSKRIFLP